jgi:predicted Fe-Mo cluster-binding NifX family protein
MKIAISTEGKSVSGHFGRCPHFTLVDIENNAVKHKQIIENPGHHPGYLPKFLKENNVECIIAGGMGRSAVALFEEYEISRITGISGNIDDVIASFIEGSLKGSDSACNPGGGKGYGIDKSVCDHTDGEGKC